MNEEELIERYGPMVYNLALRLTGDRTDAEDLAQEALIKAVRGWPSFRGESDPGTWLYRITVNAWKNIIRVKVKWRFLRFFTKEDDSVASEPVQAADPGPGPEAQAEAEERKRRIETALAELTPEERAVLVLRELDGCSYGGIAESLGIPLGTVKSRLARAREVLARRLEDDDAP